MPGRRRDGRGGHTCGKDSVATRQAQAAGRDKAEYGAVAENE